MTSGRNITSKITNCLPNKRLTFPVTSGILPVVDLGEDLIPDPSWPKQGRTSLMIEIAGCSEFLDPHAMTRQREVRSIRRRGERA